MAIKLAIANQKGGAGKSTSVMMIAEGLALYHNLRVLVVDLDPQGMISRMLIGAQALEEARKKKTTLIDLLCDERPGSLGQRAVAASDIKELRATERMLAILPCHPVALKEMTDLLDGLRDDNPKERVDFLLAGILQQELQAVEHLFDVVVFDCPGGISPLGFAALRMSSVVIAPTVLETNSLSTLIDFFRYIVDGDLGLLNTFKGRIHILINMFIRSNPAQQLLLEQITSGRFNLHALPIAIAHSTALQRASTHPGPRASRLAREKYGSSLSDVEALAHHTFRLLSSTNRNPDRTSQPLRPTFNPIRQAGKHLQ